MSRASRLCIVLTWIAWGCGGAAATPTSSTSTEAPVAPVTRTEARAPAEPVSWTFFEPVGIDPAGVVQIGGQVWGTFAGDALLDGPEEVARLDDEGRVFIRGVRTSMRVVENTLADDGEPEAVLRLEGDALVLSENGERTPIAHHRDEETRHVLLVTALVLWEMAHAYEN